MSGPKVSVVIPTCNRNDLLARAVASVQAQTYTNLEIIVIDDGEDASTVISHINDPRLTYYKNTTPRSGGPASRNVGIKYATGEFVAFLDDDDKWIPEKLAKQIAALEHAQQKTVFCFSAVRNEFDDRTEITEVPAGEMNFLARALTRFSGFLTSTLIVRRDVLVALGGFDESFPSHQEPDLIIRLCIKYDGIGINEPLTVMNVSDQYEHIGSNLERRIAGRKKILEKHMTLFSAHPKLLAGHYFRIGLWYRDSGDIGNAHEYMQKALKTSFALRYLFHSVVLQFRRLA